MHTDALLVCSDECISFIDAVETAMRLERQALVSLDIERMIHATSEKQAAVKRLEQSRHRLQKLVEMRFGVTTLSEVDAQLDESLLAPWQERQAVWARRWAELVTLAETNQGFIQHSMKNLGALIDNLKQLFGKQSLYDQSGRPKDLTGAGKVTEGRY